MSKEFFATFFNDEGAIRGKHPYKAFLKYNKEKFNELVIQKRKSFFKKDLLFPALKSDEEEINFLKELVRPPLIEKLKGWDFLFELEILVETMLLSKDDRPFSLVENSFTREWAFYVPMIKASVLSGLFRNALMNLPGVTEGEVNDLMGQTTDDKQESGLLHFYPLFFERTVMDVFTPLDPKTRYANKGPIHIEGVSKYKEKEKVINQKAIFYLSYFPLSPDMKKDMALSHLCLVCRGIDLLFNTLGVGAKRSSDFGNVKLGELRKLHRGDNYSEYSYLIDSFCKPINMPV